jgi:hypothetical protein
MQPHDGQLKRLFSNPGYERTFQPILFDLRSREPFIVPIIKIPVDGPGLFNRPEPLRDARNDPS